MKPNLPNFPFGCLCFLHPIYPKTLKIFLWLCWVLVATHGIFSWDKHDLLVVSCELFFFKMEFNCFTMFCSLLLSSKVNQLYVCIFPFLLGLPPPPYHPSRSSESTELSSCAMWQLPTSCFTDGCVYMSMSLSQFVLPSPPPNPHVHKSILYSYIFIPALQIGSSLLLVGM